MVTNEPVTQAEFAADVGISQQAVSELVLNGVLKEGDTEAQWLLAYCLRLREQAAGRLETGSLSLSQERAALAREQRIGIEIKNAVLRGRYADVELLGEVLASASQACGLLMHWLMLLAFQPRSSCSWLRPPAK